MAKKILSKLFYSFIYALIISLFASLILHITREGFEVFQTVILITLINVFLCIINFISSLTALLNLKLEIRNNKVLSLLSYFGFPILILFFIISFLIYKNMTAEFPQILIILIPSISYILSLFHNFNKIDKA